MQDAVHRTLTIGNIPQPAKTRIIAFDDPAGGVVLGTGPVARLCQRDGNGLVYSLSSETFLEKLRNLFFEASYVNSRGVRRMGHMGGVRCGFLLNGLGPMPVTPNVALIDLLHPPITRTPGVVPQVTPPVNP